MKWRLALSENSSLHCLAMALPQAKNLEELNLSGIESLGSQGRCGASSGTKDRREALPFVADIV